MQKFKFKLEAVLKIRELKEEESKQKIGVIQKEISELKILKANYHKDISEMYEGQEATLKEGVSAQKIKFMPYFLSGKKAQLDELEQKIKKLEKKLEDETTNLAKLRGDVKVVEKLKDKALTQFKKEREKKLFEALEEDYQIQKGARNRS